MNKLKLTLILGASLAMLAAPALADEEVDRTLDASRTGTVEIENTSGSIEVEGWSRDQVQVTGTIGDDVEELIFERDGDEITIKVEIEKSIWGTSDGDGDLLIRVPAGSTVEVSTVSANIEVSDVTGEQELSSVSGDIDVSKVSGDIDADTVSGDVRIEGEGNNIDVDATSVSGGVVIQSVAGSVSGDSVSGRVEVSGSEFHDVDLETVNGRIEFTGGLADGADLDAESVNGRIEVQLSQPVSASIDIETFNGSIRNCFGPKAERTSKYAPGMELSFTEGGGRASIDLETLNGTIVLCKE